MKNAYVMFRRHPIYPTKEVTRGIVACGDNVVSYREHNLDKSSVAVTWNCYGTSRRIAERVREVGGQHVMFENGYLNRKNGYYAIGMDGINGNESNAIENISDERFKKLNLNVEPWNKKGKYILVCAQRGGGYNNMAMPNSWPEEIMNRIHNVTDMEIKYRPHPERQVNVDFNSIHAKLQDHREAIENQIKDAFAIVVFTSNAANEALMLGIPVFYCGPTISCSHLALQEIDKIETPFYPDNRQQYFNYLSHRQWHKEEIEKGDAWKNLVH